MLGEFTGVRLPRPDPTMVHGHACVMHHSWRLLPQSVARCTLRLMGVLVGVGEVCARRRLTSEAATSISLAKDIEKHEFE